MEKDYRFLVSKDLKKVIPLPKSDEFQVHPQDLLISSNLRSFIKTKGVLFNNTSSVAERYLALTKQGYLLLWMQSTKGFVFNIRKAKSINVVTERYKYKGSYLLGCLIKIKFPFGSVNILLENENIVDWRRSLQEVFDDFPKETETKMEEATPTDILEEEFVPTKKSDSMMTCCGDLQKSKEDSNENNSFALRSETEISITASHSPTSNALLINNNNDSLSSCILAKEYFKNKLNTQSSIASYGRRSFAPVSRCESTPTMYNKSTFGGEGVVKMLDSKTTNMNRNNTPIFINYGINGWRGFWEM